MDKVKKLFGLGKEAVNKAKDNFLPFPEFTNMDTALGEAALAHVKYTQNLNESIAHSFTEFANKQPLTVCEVLTDVQKQETERYNIIQGNNESFRNLKTGLQQIKPLNDAMREKRKHLKELQSKVQKMIKAHESANQKYARQNIKNPSSPETSKLKMELDRALQRKEDSERELEQFMTTFIIDNKSYKKEIYATMLNMLVDFSTKFAQSCEDQVPIAQEIARYGALVPEYTDAGIQQVQEELDTLRAANSTE